MPRRVLIVYYERIVLAGEIGGYAVDGTHAYAPAAYAFSRYLKRAALSALETHTASVWVRAADIYSRKRKCKTVFSGDTEAVRDARVVRLHAEQSGDKRSVCAVAVPRECEASMKSYLRVYGLVLKQLARHPAYTHGTRRVTAGRTGHNRSENIE